MKIVAGEADRGPVLSSAIVLAAIAALSFATLTELPLDSVVPVIAATVIGAVWYRQLLAWRSLLALLILVILLIPIRRYTLPGSLPFELEPYRLLVAFIAAGWVSSLLVDPRVAVRRSGFEGPLLLLVAAAVGSVAVNGGRIGALGIQTEAAEALTFFLSFVLIFYVIVSVIRSQEAVDLLVRFLVGGGCIVAVLAVIESRTGSNPFNNLAGVVPLLQEHFILEAPGRGARLRAYASAQHPIALSAALVMLVPLAVYLTQRRTRLWWIAVALLAAGAVGTVSRTGIVMLIAGSLVFLWLRPKETKRLWPAVVPILVMIHFALPGTLGSLRASFFPAGGLIEEQKGNTGTQGRLADIGPSLEEWAQQPVLGQGYGTRITVGERKNARILDNQWLGSLLETGLVGALALVWLFIRFIRTAGHAAKVDPSPRGWLLAALASSVTAFSIGMFTFDAFSFIQVSFLLYILLALGAAVLQDAGPASRRSLKSS